MSERQVPEIGAVDLAAERVGGRAVLANDEFFAPKENLLKPGRGVFVEGKYTDRGKWMDGWETRRRRGPGHDWCLIRLGLPGAIRRAVVDTNHFRGNHPESCSLGAVEAGEEADAAGLAESREWTEVVPRSPLVGHAENVFEVHDPSRYTHVRLDIFPDGGVARLRVYGEVRPDWRRILAAGGPVDLVAVEHGGLPLACSDRFFSEPLNLLMPGRAANMGDGWETRRRRGPGHDWVTLRLGRRGVIERAEVHTTHFKGNFPESCRLEACDAPGAPLADLTEDAVAWRTLLPRTRLEADARHVFADELAAVGPVTHVRFAIFPDGGVSRLRLYGRPEPA